MLIDEYYLQTQMTELEAARSSALLNSSLEQAEAAIAHESKAVSSQALGSDTSLLGRATWQLERSLTS